MDRIQKTIATVGVQLIVAFCAGLVACDASAQQSEAERVIHIRSRPLGEWIQDLQSDNATKRYVASVHVLPTAREHAAVIVPRLIEILEDPRVDVRCTAARALAGFHEAAREAVPALERSLDDQAGREDPCSEAGGMVSDREGRYGTIVLPRSVSQDDRRGPAW